MAKILNNDERLTQRLIPSFPMGCRRLGPAEGFLEAFHESNVELAEGEIASFTENGLRTTDGKEHTADVIICATGFEVSFRPQFPVIGSNGLSLSEAWKEEPSAYLAVAASGFPNFMSEFKLHASFDITNSGSWISGPQLSRWARILHHHPGGCSKLRLQDNSKDPDREHPFFERQAGSSGRIQRTCS